MTHELLSDPDSTRELTALLLATDTFETYVQQVVELAAARVQPGSSCGLTLRRDGRTSTVASSDQLASQVDELQYAAGTGPCLQAMDTQQVVLVTDLGTEDRWGDYRLHAISQGVRSSLSVPIPGTVTGAAGALNLYSRFPGAFTTDHVDRAQRFADHATGALQLATRLAEQTTLNRNLQAAMATRSVIDQAIGVVMAQNRCSADTAFGILRRASQNRNIKLWHVATDIITAVSGTPATPSPTVTK
jgi:GAF domain-containing protein